MFTASEAREMSNEMWKYNEELKSVMDNISKQIKEASMNGAYSCDFGEVNRESIADDAVKVLKHTGYKVDKRMNKTPENTSITLHIEW